MKQRCLNKSNPKYPLYGGRGIQICDRWKDSYELFLKDVGRRPSRKHSLDRIDVNGNYEPGNCRWATPREQANNTRANVLVTIRGDTKTTAQWADHAGIDRLVLCHRIKRGWPADHLLDPVWSHRNCVTGERSHNAKLTADDVREIVRAYTAGDGTSTSLAKTFGVSKQSVLHILHGKAWRHVTGISMRIEMVKAAKSKELVSSK